jgi:hypothetical protein
VGKKMKYYHVIKKQSQWLLYADNAEKALAADTSQSALVQKARRLARQHGAKVILHKEDPLETGLPASLGTAHPA